MRGIQEVDLAVLNREVVQRHGEDGARRYIGNEICNEISRVQGGFRRMQATALLPFALSRYGANFWQVVRF